MTVISKSQKKYEFPTSHNNSDTESLHLGSAAASDAESLHNEPLPTRRVRLLRHTGLFSKLEDHITYPKHSGKRRLRRYQNCTTLQALSEEEEDNVNCIFEQVKSPLSKLFQDPIAWECWNEFMEKSEEEQTKIITYNTEQKSEIHNDDKVEKLFLRISSKIRRTLKIKRNLSAETVKSFEDDIISFFNSSPKEKYVKYPHTSFDRLLTHAVAQFHRLYSSSVWENKKRKVEILNFMDNWTPAEHFLYEWIMEKKS